MVDFNLYFSAHDKFVWSVLLLFFFPPFVSQYSFSLFGSSLTSPPPRARFYSTRPCKRSRARADDIAVHRFPRPLTSCTISKGVTYLFFSSSTAPRALGHQLFARPRKTSRELTFAVRDTRSTVHAVT